MKHQAHISSHYRWRLLIVGLVGVLASAWFAYDGFIGYPRANVIASEYASLEDKYRNAEGQVDGNKVQEQWALIAKEKGYPVQPGPAKQANDIPAQFLMMGLTLVVGLYFWLAYVMSSKRWIALDDQGLSNSQGIQVPLGQITKLNKTRWARKGIAYAYFDAGDGKGEQKFLIDDWKYERKETDTMIQALESKLSPDQVVGQDPVPEADSAADAAGENTSDSPPPTDSP